MHGNIYFEKQEFLNISTYNYYSVYNIPLHGMCLCGREIFSPFFILNSNQFEGR